MKRMDILDAPLVSIVVPVYNVEKYVEECVKSILNQTYANLNVILVDDGSTDNSGTLCDRLAATDARVITLHKENGGLSDARNYGLRHAEGEWVAFVDSDDYVSPVFVEALLSAALSSGCDVAAVPGGHYFRDGGAVRLVHDMDELPELRLLHTCDVQRLMLYQMLATGAQWRLYRHNRGHDVLGDDPFPVGLLYEDLASTYKFVRAAGKNIAYVESRDLYAYRLRPTSIIRQAYSSKKADSAIAVSRQIYADICAWYPSLMDAAASRCFSVNRMVYAQATTTLAVERECLWSELLKYCHIVAADSRARKRERFAATIACMGEKPFFVFCLACRKMGLLQ